MLMPDVNVSTVILDLTGVPGVGDMAKALVLFSQSEYLVGILDTECADAARDIA